MLGTVKMKNKYEIYVKPQSGITLDKVKIDLNKDLEKMFAGKFDRIDNLNFIMDLEIRKYCVKKGISSSRRSLFNNFEAIYCKGEMVTVIYDKLNKNVVLIYSLVGMYVDMIIEVKEEVKK